MLSRGHSPLQATNVQDYCREQAIALGTGPLALWAIYKQLSLRRSILLRLYCNSRRTPGMKKSEKVLGILALIAATPSMWAGSSCDGVKRGLTNNRKHALAPKIATELRVKNVDVLQSFQLGKWNIIYVDTHESDEQFLFYADDPLKERHVTEWSGAAFMNEEQDIKQWTIKNAPGIPSRLATCFAWHVTKDRDQ